MNQSTAGGQLLPVDAVVPPRSVLTELARGFLLTREGDGRRAAQFATTFLRERHGASPPAVEPPAPESIPFGRRYLGLLPHGAVERPSGLASR